MDIAIELPLTETGRKRWTRQQVTFLENACLLKSHYELIDGEIISKMGQSPAHAMAIMRGIAFLLSTYGPNRVQTQATMEVRADDRVTNRPEPNIVVLREPIMHIPYGEDVLLAVEISDTTQADDFGRKVSLYARAGVCEYWVVDLTRRMIVVYQSPSGDDWLIRTEYRGLDTVATLAAPQDTIAVAELLPPLDTAS